MTQVVLMGAGNMGSALLRGWVTAWDTKAAFHVIDPAPVNLSEHPRVALYATIRELPPKLVPDVVIIAVKPDKVADVIDALAHTVAAETCVVSVAAGVGIAAMRASLGVMGHVVRVMPNIGAMTGYSVSAGYAEPGVPKSLCDLLTGMFSSIGQMSWLDEEKHLHLVTALSGSGPAYYFAISEAMREAATGLGLSADTAHNLSVGTLISAGRLLAETPAPEDLRRRVTSPNGTTAAGLAALASEDRLGALVRATLKAAQKRSVELSGN